MNIFATIALPLSLSAAALAPQAATANDAVQLTAATANAADFKGKMLFGPSGERLAAVYKIGADGSAQIILNGKMVVVPASSLSAADGKLSTSLSKRDLSTAH
jgi:hypothetical protein